MTELAIVNNHALQPQSFKELREFAEIAARTDMVPKDFKDKPGNIIIACQMGMELGMSVANALQSFAIINGRASLWGDMVIGLVRGSGKCEYVTEWLEGEQGRDDKNEIDISLDTRIAFCETKRKGEAEPVMRSFSVQQARKAGLWLKKDTPWVTYPERQLQMRARGFCLRDVYADVLKGVSLAEEVSDYDQPTNVTPAVEAAPVRTRADAVREAMELASAKKNAVVEPAPAETGAVVEGVVEDPLPNFDVMLIEQIGETMNEEAMTVGMTPAELKELIPLATGGKKPSRANAPAIVTAIRKWGADKKAAEEAAASLNGDPAHDAPLVAAQDAAIEAARPAIEAIDYSAHKCPTHGTPTSECESDGCRAKVDAYVAMAGQPTLLDGVPA